MDLLKRLRRQMNMTIKREELDRREVEPHAALDATALD